MVRHATDADFAFVEELYFHPQTNPFLLYEMSEKPHFRSIFADLQAKQIVFIFETAGGERIGMFKLAPWTFRTSHIAYLGGVAIHPNFAGQGFGTLMMREILDFGKAIGYRRIELSTATVNEKAIHLYEKLGFQREGILRNYTFLKTENRFLDEVMMSILFDN